MAGHGCARRESVEPARRAPSAEGLRAPPEPVEVEPEDGRLLFALYHAQWVLGDLDGVERGLRALLGRGDLAAATRARAALRLTEIADVRGDRREALSFVERAKFFAGPATGLAAEADDWRARILTAAPLADVRGPAPGAVALKNESFAVVAAFRRAEKLLSAFHRVVVAPSLETIDQVLRGKRRALAAAVKAYQEVVQQGGAAARGAALFRMAAMYHHLAEALAFERPPEMLPSVARSLTRRLRAESATYLHKAFALYRSAAEVGSGAGAGPWRRLAGQEAATLALVLKRPERGRPAHRGE